MDITNSIQYMLFKKTLEIFAEHNLEPILTIDFRFIDCVVDLQPFCRQTENGYYLLDIGLKNKNVENFLMDEDWVQVTTFMGELSVKVNFFTHAIVSLWADGGNLPEPLEFNAIMFDFVKSDAKPFFGTVGIERVDTSTKHQPTSIVKDDSNVVRIDFNKGKK